MWRTRSSSAWSIRFGEGVDGFLERVAAGRTPPPGSPNAQPLDRRRPGRWFPPPVTGPVKAETTCRQKRRQAPHAACVRIPGDRDYDISAMNGSRSSGTKGGPGGCVQEGHSFSPRPTTRTSGPIRVPVALAACPTDCPRKHRDRALTRDHAEFAKIERQDTAAVPFRAGDDCRDRLGPIRRLDEIRVEGGPDYVRLAATRTTGGVTKPPRNSGVRYRLSCPRDDAIEDGEPTEAARATAWSFGEAVGRIVEGCTDADTHPKPPLAGAQGGVSCEARHRGPLDPARLGVRQAPQRARHRPRRARRRRRSLEPLQRPEGRHALVLPQPRRGIPRQPSAPDGPHRRTRPDCHRDGDPREERTIVTANRE